MCPTSRSRVLARQFHSQTEHAPGKPSRPGPLDPSIEPEKVKRYLDASTLGLPAHWPDPGTPAVSSLSGAHFVSRDTIDIGQISRVLFLSNGITRPNGIGGPVPGRPERRPFRAAPSAGALYPVEIYVICGDIPGLPAGVYHYEPDASALRVLRSGDFRATIAHAADYSELARRPASLVLTGIPWRTTWKYGPRGYRHLFWDAGAILANTMSAAVAAGIPAEVLVNFADEPIARLLDLGEHLPFVEWPVAIATLGARGRTAPSVAEPKPLKRPVQPLSLREISEPEAATLHLAGNLSDPGAVRSSRALVTALDLPRAQSEPVIAPDKVKDPLLQSDWTMDQVILRRGSTRGFDSSSQAPTTALLWCLAVAMREIAGDIGGGRTLLTAFAIVHSVAGLEPGGYKWTADGVEQVTGAKPRSHTEHMCKDQRLGGTSAFTAFLCSDLDPLLEAIGARGYRAAQLAAGVAAGRLQLAAFALGLGGTGLTFYDDAVRKHFGISSDPMLGVAIGASSYRGRPGQRT